MDTNIKIHAADIEKFCQKHKIKKLSFFGSVLGEDFSADSDVDVLVEFEPGAHVGLGFFRIEQELSELLGRRVDLNTPGFLSRHFREEVKQKAQVVYDTT